MNGLPRPSLIRRAGRIAGTIGKAFAYTLAGLMVVGWATLIIMGNFVWDKEPQPAATPSPSPSPSTRIYWIYQGSRCADGWNSPSIGRRGACSHHGGVVATYTSSSGSLWTTCGPRFQPTTLERARDLADANGWVPCVPKDYVGE